jgi:hypothetical protein
MTREELDRFLNELHARARERERREQEKQQPAERGRHLTDAEIAHWDQHFAALIAAERDHMKRLMSELIAQAREEIRAEIETAYKKAFDPLRLDVDALKHELRKLSGGPYGEPVELPNPIGRLN